jgi:exonuclease III
MITNNLNVSDGLVNGAVGFLKKVVMTKNKNELTPIVQRCWLDFIDKDIGQKSRSENRELFHVDSINAKDQWTPIELQKQIIKTASAGRFEIERTQFPLVECEAMTIHKSQGQTYLKIGVGLTNSMSRALLYVAMSRVTTINGLFLFGLPSIQKEKYQKMKPAAKQIEIEKNYQDRKVNIEMKRLREKCSIENLYTFLNDNTLNNINNDDKLAIMFHNIRAFNNDKKNHIQYDHGFRKADVIMLVETHTQLKHTRHVQLNDYKVLFTSGSNQKYSSHGQICFVKNSKINFFTLLAHNANQQTYESKNMLELSLFEYMCPTGKDIFYICLLYKHPQMKNSEFAYEFEEFISKHFRIINNNRIDKNLFILGDFNIDFNKKNKMMNYMKSEFGLFPIFSKTQTHDSGSQIDWCFTNVITKDNLAYETIIYESWFSDHKPIWLQIKN